MRKVNLKAHFVRAFISDEWHVLLYARNAEGKRVPITMDFDEEDEALPAGAELPVSHKFDQEQMEAFAKAMIEGLIEAGLYKPPMSESYQKTIEVLENQILNQRQLVDRLLKMIEGGQHAADRSGTGSKG